MPSSLIKVSRCDSPIVSPLTAKSDSLVPMERHTRVTSTVASRRLLKRGDLDMNVQLRVVKQEQQHRRQKWLETMKARNNDEEFQVHSIKYAVAESIIYHHRNGSTALSSMLDGEADKKGTPTSDPSSPAAAKSNKPVKCCGLPKHYLTVLMDDIELISRLDGCPAALNSIRALPLWRLAK